MTLKPKTMEPFVRANSYGVTEEFSVWFLFWKTVLENNLIKYIVHNIGVLRKMFKLFEFSILCDLCVFRTKKN